jgi:hypothetical protein
VDAASGTGSSSAILVSVGCPACRVQVVSASLGMPELLERHLRYCSWEPSSKD